MAELDPTIPLKAVPPQFDPLATMGKLQGVQQGILQNRLLGQEVKGKIARGVAAQNAIDPTTGAFNPDKFMTNLREGGPDAAQFAPEAAGVAQTQRNLLLDAELKKLGLDKAKLELSALRWGKLGDTTSALLSQKEPLTREAVIKTLSDNLVGSGMFNDPESVGQLTSFVQGLPNDDAGLRERLKGAYLSSGETTQRIASLLGAPTNVDTGPTITSQQVSPLTGEMSVNGVITKGRTPSERATMVQVFDPETNTTKLVPSGQVIGDAPAMGPAGGVQAGPALGQSEAAAGAATGAVRQLDALRTAAEKVPETNAALLNIRDQLAKFTPGPKANWSYLTGALAQQLGVAPPKVTEGVAAQEEFNKLATQFINQQVGQLGGTGTDSKLESAAKGAPNEFMSKEGILGVTSLMLGLNDALSAKNMAAQKWLDAGNGPETYPKFVSQFNQYYNPRVFQSAYMTEPQKANMFKGMSKEEREAFQKDWIFAKKAGWIK